MNTSRPYIPVLVTGPGGRLPRHAMPTGPFVTALEINTTSTPIEHDVIAQLIEGDIPFMLLINNADGVQALSPQLAELITMCLFSRNYVRISDAPVISFRHSPQKNDHNDGDDFANALLQTLQLQGWKQFHPLYLPAGVAFIDQLVAGGGGSALLIQKIDVDEKILLRHYFSNAVLMGQYIFFDSRDGSDAATLEGEFFTLCVSAIEQNELLSIYLSSYLQAKQTLALSDNENRVLRERLTNAEHTIEIIRTKYKADYDILFNWYQKEYEALPLWYKRAGQLIKVATGKRTFKSLFSDDPAT